MLKISKENPASQILPFVKNWMKLLADDRFQDACEMIDRPNSYGIIWTPDLIKATINETFSPDTVFYDFHPEGPIITNPFELEEQRFIEVVEFDGENGYAFEYDLPLNNERSDLTAQFEFIKDGDDYAFVLHDLHMM